MGGVGRWGGKSLHCERRSVDWLRHGRFHPRQNGICEESRTWRRYDVGHWFGRHSRHLWTTTSFNERNQSGIRSKYKQMNSINYQIALTIVDCTLHWLVANPMWSDCLRMKSMGYSSSGLYSIKNAQSQPDDDDDSAYKTIYCDFTRHQPVSAGISIQFNSIKK